MMQPTTAQALGQARLAALHHQAEHDALARAARPARAARSQPRDHAPGTLAALTGWARHPRPAPESS
jgi:hypothetical protein